MKKSQFKSSKGKKIGFKQQQQQQQQDQEHEIRIRENERIEGIRERERAPSSSIISTTQSNPPFVYLSETDKLQIRKVLHDLDNSRGITPARTSQISTISWDENAEMIGWGSPRTPYRQVLDIDRTMVDNSMHLSNLASPKPKSIQSTPRDSNLFSKPIGNHFADDKSISIPERTIATNQIETTSSVDFSNAVNFESVEIPVDVRLRVLNAKKELEKELSRQRAVALESLKDALRIGSEGYLDDLKVKLQSISTTEKLELPISMEFELQRKQLFHAIISALVEEAKLTFYQNNEAFDDNSAISTSQSLHVASTPIPENCRMELLQLTEQLKSKRLRQLEEEIERESTSQVREIDKHLRSREAFWQQKISSDVQNIAHEKKIQYLKTRKSAVQTNVNRLRGMLANPDCSELSEARRIGSDCLLSFKNRIKSLSGFSSDELYQSLISSREVELENSNGLQSRSSMSSIEITPSGKAHSFKAERHSVSSLSNSLDDTIYSLLSSLQNFSLITSLAKHKLESIGPNA